MSKEEEFLKCLKYPNREKVSEDIQYWLCLLDPKCIIDIRVDVEDTRHIVTIITDTAARLTWIDLSFERHFLMDYKHGAAYVDGEAWYVSKPPTSPHDFQVGYQRKYTVEEYQ